MESSSPKRYSFKNLFKDNVTVLSLDERVIELDEVFMRFWAKQLDFHSKVNLVDPRMKNFEFRLLTGDDGKKILYGGVKEMFEYYGLKNQVTVHLTYSGDNVFLFRMFSYDGIQMSYERTLDNISFNVSTARDTIMTDCDDGEQSMLKLLTAAYDV